MALFFRKLSSIFFPTHFVRASKQDQDNVRLKQKRSFVLLEKYDKGEIKINYSIELNKLKKFAKAN